MKGIAIVCHRLTSQSNTTFKKNAILLLCYQIATIKRLFCHEKCVLNLDMCECDYLYVLSMAKKEQLKSFNLNHTYNTNYH